MKLSIIIPVYNVRQWLEETVNSVLNQTFRDFELILVDDGATDGSGELCDAFAVMDSRVRVIHQENAGVSAARNAGLDAARGAFIGWVDSDDIIEADMFQRLVMLAESHNADIVQCQHDRAGTLNASSRTNAVEVLGGPGFVRRMFTKRSGAYTNQVSLCNKLFRRELFNDIRFPRGQVYEDEMQTYKVCLKAEKIVETEDVLYHYVKRENSIITGETHKKMLDKQKALEDRLNYLPEKLPDLEAVCAQSFLGFSANILCQMYKQDDVLSVQQGIERLLAYRKKLKEHISKYDRIYLRRLKSKRGIHWVLSNDFEPIQKIIRRLKL
jgi:glycosyltransferase involved in cell wall biosynthesis